MAFKPWGNSWRKVFVQGKVHPSETDVAAWSGIEQGCIADGNGPRTEALKDLVSISPKSYRLKSTFVKTIYYDSNYNGLQAPSFTV